MSTISIIFNIYLKKQDVQKHPSMEVNQLKKGILHFNFQQQQRIIIVAAMPSRFNLDSACETSPLDPCFISPSGYTTLMQIRWSYFIPIVALNYEQLQQKIEIEKYINRNRNIEIFLWLKYYNYIVNELPK